MIRRSLDVLLQTSAVTALAILPLAAAVVACAQTPAPGAYSSEQGWQTLEVKHIDGETSFSMSSFHLGATDSDKRVCKLGGEVRDGRSVLQMVDGQSCIVTFDSDNEQVDISVNNNIVCSQRCDFVVSFAGLYFRLPDECAVSARHAARDRSKQFYDQRRFTDARATLQSLLERCGRFLEEVEEGWIRNELALTQHRLGDDAACRRTLVPLTSNAGQSDEEMRQNLGYRDAETWLPLFRATRVNLKLCGTDARP